jgi:hypothetical protein
MPAQLLVYLLHTVEKAIWQHIPSYSLAFLTNFVRGLSYIGHCLLGCITNTFSGLPTPKCLYDGGCFTLCANNFQSHSATVFSILHNGNSEGSHFTLATVEEAVLQHVPAVHCLHNGLCARLLYSMPACFPPDHKFPMWSFWTIRWKIRIQILIIVNLKCTIWHVIHITV